MGNRIFIDRDVRVFEGDEAAARLSSRSDARFYEPGRGVAKVDHDRWLEAQAYERTTWLERNRGAADDRNHDHFRRFEGYRALAGRRFDRAIELGCGPFTNLRLILPLTETAHVHLLDPLIRDYVHHPQCRYRRGRLGGLLRAPSAESLLAWRHPSSALRELVTSVRAGGIRGRPVQLEASSIEDFEPGERFDLVVMINVLEHCRDAPAVLEKIGDILVPGGTFVFHDRFVPSGRLAETVEEVFDAGHPIRIDRAVVDRFLEARFELEFRAEFRDVDEFGGREFEVSSLYVIGRRRP